ncbi:hypothetical protein TNCV_3870691 [Trichonephila clavipes]|nr:hypothetical protein TNCV_3870691 [Trichonephila clavipes]
MKEQILCIVTGYISNMVKTIQNRNEGEEFVKIDENRTALDIETSQEYSYEALDDVAEDSSKLCQIKQMHCAVHSLLLKMG